MNKTRLNAGLSVALLAMLAASCGGGSPKVDAKADARDATVTDTTSDRGDTTPEAGPDLRPDVQPDMTGPDVQPDMAGPDVQPDVVVGPDVQPDVVVGPDVQPDTAGPDAGGPDVVAPTYVISGNVSGLAGTGLVLRNGTENLTIAPTATIVPFAFTTRVATGGTYAVTVMTQPSAPTQICTVTMGAGTVASANVTNVAVTCATQSFTVNYTVSGLTGTGMVVRNNGLAASDMPVTANGTFNFPAQLSGTAYAVTVQTQPSSPTQICTVANGSGTVGGANVTNVMITCATQAFTVGGSISGLTGTVVLRNSGMASTDLTRTTNGAFTFAASVATGGTYAVTVQTQPAGQTCTVANGAGTIAAANVTNVNVTCTTNPTTFTIGGTISGLTGTVVLDFGSAAGAPADVSRTTNGVYASAAVPTGTAYTVTVQTQPAGQTCTVANPTGTVASADVTNVNVTCTTNPTTFTIGGTVSGLAASTMVTLDFGAAAGAPADVTRNADGVYASAAVPTGTAYTVTVQTQPTGQTCTVANPTGTVAAANVTNVNVTCTANATTFSIGGTISGLAASTTVVLDFGSAANAPVDVSRSANGAYASALVPTGTVYTVTVQTQPAGQTCTVANGTGTVAAVNVTNVNVTCVAGTAVQVCAVGPFDPMPTGTGDDAVLTCPQAGQLITAIEFASFGTPSGTCLTYIQDHPPTEPVGSPVCHSATSVSRVTTACMGMHSCTVTASQAADPAGFGDPCPGFSKWLVFRATCQ